MDYKENLMLNPTERCNLTITRAIDLYCERGWYIHPLNGKIPLLKNWQNQASIDPVVVKQWFEEWSHASLGVVTGACSNLLVLDIDGEEGKNSIVGLELPNTLSAITSRGTHYYFNFPESLKNISTTKAGLFSGVDTRGRGGFIVAPPSLHKTRHQYCWANSLNTVLADAPEWLVQSLSPLKKESYKETVLIFSKSSRYAQAALIKELIAISTAPKGKRNTQLNHSAFAMGTLIASGCINIECVTETLAQAALNIGLNQSEVKKTLYSGLSAGMQHPRKVSHG